jgi:hypothetical protein
VRRASVRDPPQTGGRLTHDSRGRVSSGRRAYASGVELPRGASKRDQREYAERPVLEEAVGRSLDAGGPAGSAKNRRPWRFLVLGTVGWSTRVAQSV